MSSALNRNHLLMELQQLLPSQFEELVFKLRIGAYLSAATASQTIRAMELLQYLESRARLDELPGLLTYLWREEDSDLPLSGRLARYVLRTTRLEWAVILQGLRGTTPRRPEVAQVVRNLSEDQLAAVAALGRAWHRADASWRAYFSGDRIHQAIWSHVKRDQGRAIQMREGIRTLGLIQRDPAYDDDQSSDINAYVSTPLLMIVYESLRAAGLFPETTGDRRPVSLSECLTYSRPRAYLIHPSADGNGFGATIFDRVRPTKFGPAKIVVMNRHINRTWVLAGPSGETCSVLSAWHPTDELILGIDHESDNGHRLFEDFDDMAKLRLER